MENFEALTPKQFNDMPLVTEGESKVVRYAGDGQAVIQLKPTVYSYTHNRTGEVEGTDILRLDAIKATLPVLQEADVQHTYAAVSGRWIVSQLVLQPHQADKEPAFRPADLSASEISQLPVAPPIEVVVKKRHVGTPKHRYYQFGSYPTRSDHPSLSPRMIQDEDHYPHTVVRFDWRNPMTDNQGNRLADEVLTEEMADWFIDVKEAKKTAKKAFNALEKHLKQHQLDLWDICFFITQDGKHLFGEVSPDCLRVRVQDGSPLDKDIWRSGGSSEDLTKKWRQFSRILTSTSTDDTLATQSTSNGIE